MKLNKAHIVVAFLLILSYSTTIPVLSVVHAHSLPSAADSPSVRGQKTLEAKTHLPFCAVCSRINTSQVVLTFSDLLPTMEANYETVVQQTEHTTCSNHFSLLQNRAPPADHTVV